MLRRQSKGARNRLDLNDRVQVRIVRKRLKVSDRQLSQLVQTVGNSIAAVTKEANARRGLAQANEASGDAIIPSAQNAEAAVDEANPAAGAPQPA